MTEADRSEMHKNMEIPTLEQVRDHVENKKVKVNNKKRGCSDGRAQEEEAEGGIRSFGEDFGFLLAFKAILNEKGRQVSDDELISAFLNAQKELWEEEPQLFVHTAEDHEGPGEIGCGHANQASNPENEGKYGVSSDEARALYFAMKARPEAKITVLKGEHEEKAVIKVFGEDDIEPKYSVSSQDKDGKNTYFVIDMTRTEMHFKVITPLISKILDVQIGENEGFEKHKTQMNVSAEILAKGLPSFNAFFDEKGKSRVEEVEVN